MVVLEFDLNYMKEWIHPDLYQRFRLIVMQMLVVLCVNINKPELKWN